MKTLVFVALLVGLASAGCGGKPEAPAVAVATPAPDKLTREQATTLIGAKVADPNFGRDYLVGQIGLSFAGQKPEVVDRITASKLVGVTGIATAADGRTALVEYAFTVGGGTPTKAEAAFRLYDDGWRVDKTFARLK